MRRLLLLGLAIVLVGSALPVTAQGAVLVPSVQLELAEPAGPLEPSEEPTLIRGRLIYEREQPVGIRDAEYRIRIVEAPAWADATVEGAAGSFATGPTGTGVTFHEAAFQLHVRVIDHAPAFRPAAICLEAHVTSDGAHMSMAARMCVGVTADFRPDTRVSTPTRTIETSEGVIVPTVVYVENRGNGPIRVHVDTSDSDRQFFVRSPMPVTLDTADAGHDRHRATLAVQIEVPVNATPGDVRLRVTSAYALDRTIGVEEHELTVRIIPHPDEARDNPTPVGDPVQRSASSPDQDPDPEVPEDRAAVPLPALLALLGGVAAARLRGRAGRR